MLDRLSRAVATRPAEPLPRLQPSPLPSLLRGRRAVGKHLDAVGAEDVRREVQQRKRRVLDWLRAVITFGRHDAGRIIAGRHVDGRVENGTLDVVEVAERVARSLVANCVVWSQLVDVTAEEPPAAIKEAEK